MIILKNYLHINIYIIEKYNIILTYLYFKKFTKYNIILNQSMYSIQIYI